MASLKIESGPLEGRVVEIAEEDVTFGRAPDTTITLDDVAVSGHHCCVTRDDRKYTLRDLNSTNGTRLNGDPVTESRLKPGDVITLGAVDILFSGEDVDVEDAYSVPATIRQAPLGASDSAARAAGPGPSPFGARRDTHWKWLSVIVFVGVVALGALAWFVYQLLQA